jgi:hypothetical protein
MSTSTAATDSPVTDPRSRGRGRQAQVVAIVLIVIGCLGLVVRNLNSNGATGTGSHTMPQNAAMEEQLGIRFSSLAVVGDGGLLTLTYVVLDSEKASKFQNDTAHPPVITSEQRKGSASRVSLMKQGHTLRAGQKYYLVYQNPADLVRHDEKVAITYGRLSLKHVPVW